MGATSSKTATNAIEAGMKAPIKKSQTDVSSLSKAMVIGSHYDQ